MKKYNVLLFSVIILQVSCVKLIEEPMSSLSPNNFYKTSTEIESAYAASVNKLWNSWSGYGYTTVFYNDDQLDGGDLNIGVNHANSLWNAHYASILNINAALKSALSGNVTGLSQVQLDELIGEGKFLRAFNYFQLVRMFGDVPLYLETDDPGVNPEPRSAVSEVYAQIVDDFKDAASKLPRTRDASKIGRPVRSVANGLLAKAYLTMATAPLNETANYALAAAAAKAAMDDGDRLLPNCTDVFDFANKFGKEVMWSFNSTMDDKATDAQMWSGSEKPWQGWANFAADRSWALNFPNQPRKDAYLVLYNGEGVYYTEWKVGRTVPGIRKYLYGPMSEYNAYQSRYNLPILRYADVLLMYAEAANMANGGPTTEAVEAVNRVIRRANGYQTNVSYPELTTSMTAAAFDKAVIRERDLELCFEYDRWFDLLRKRMLRDVVIQYNDWILPNFSDNDYLFPIPEADLRLNKLIIQNPGYPTP